MQRLEAVRSDKLETKIIFRGNPVEGETISGGTMGDVLETKCGKK